MYKKVKSYIILKINLIYNVKYDYTYVYIEIPTKLMNIMFSNWRDIIIYNL